MPVMPKDKATSLYQPVLEQPFETFVRDLHDVDRNSPEYRRVQELYGPARIAYLNKKRAEKPK